MGAKHDAPPVDRLIAGLAARQHGVAARRQLKALGLGDRGIETRVAAGRLHRVHQGVYAVGHTALPRNGRLMAAVLACGEEAVLSHRSAAELWGIRPPARFLDVTAVGGRGPRRGGLVVHRGYVPPGQRTVVHAIPVTTPGRTLVDLADVLTRRGLERAIDEAEYLRLDCTGLSPIPGRRGAGVLAQVLAGHEAGSTRTRSQLEEMFLAMCEAHSLTQPEVNVHVEGYEVDFLWRDRRLVVELDGAAAHYTRRAFERDRARDAELTLAGYRVVRVTHTRLAREADAVADQLRRAVGPGARGRSSRSRAARRRRPRP